jgi:GDP-L-fucose synthase
MSLVQKSEKIYIAGHLGMVGSALVRRLKNSGYTNLLTVSRKDLDLKNQAEVGQWFSQQRPDHVILAAGKVGGIDANRKFPADFIYDNMVIHTNVIEAARRNDVKRLLYLGSSCIYPRNAANPIKESELLTGELEATNEWYALAKITGIKMCQAYRLQYGVDYISAMPTNLYGPNDNFDLATAHVLPALIRKFVEASKTKSKHVEIWGTGEPRREFMHVDDLADACIFLLEKYSDYEHVNIGTGVDHSIREVAEILSDLILPGAELQFDVHMPNGTLRKRLDVTKLRDLGWSESRSLKTGIKETIDWYLDAIANNKSLRQ